MRMRALVVAAMAGAATAAVAPSVVHAEPVTAVVAGKAVIKTAIVDWAKKRLEENAKATGREKTLLDKGIRLGTGVSVKDIKKNGLAGGKNSEARKAGRKIAKVFGW